MELNDYSIKSRKFLISITNCCLTRFERNSGDKYLQSIFRFWENILSKIYLLFIEVVRSTLALSRKLILCHIRLRE